jgi:uncharacterized protein YjdB
MKKIVLLLIAALALSVSCRELHYAANGYVRRVTLNTNQVELVLGQDQSFKLEATISPMTAPNRKLIWSSSNWSVAEVDDKGVVTPKSIGESVVTVKTDDGGYTDDCKVIVKDKE